MHNLAENQPSNFYSCTEFENLCSSQKQTIICSSRGNDFQVLQEKNSVKSKYKDGAAPHHGGKLCKVSSNSLLAQSVIHALPGNSGAGNSWLRKKKIEGFSLKRCSLLFSVRRAILHIYFWFFFYYTTRYSNWTLEFWEKKHIPLVSEMDILLSFNRQILVDFPLDTCRGENQSFTIATLL